MTNKEMLVFYRRLKDVKCPFTDKFCEDYRQSSSGNSKTNYIDKAMEKGIEPTQCWHLTESYVEYKKEVLKTNEAFLNWLDKTTSTYNDLRCPELVLWMAEVVGCNVELAYNNAVTAIKEHQDACKAIKKEISWNDILEKIKEMFS